MLSVALKQSLVLDSKPVINGACVLIDGFRQYIDLGISSFILSGYPHQTECELFAKYVLPRFKKTHLPKLLGRVPSSTPNTPLGVAPRI